jgi:hypothetical protein
LSPCLHWWRKASAPHSASGMLHDISLFTAPTLMIWVHGIDDFVSQNTYYSSFGVSAKKNGNGI